MCSQLTVFFPELSLSRKWLWTLFFLLWLPVLASADAYLDAIQAAAEDVELDPATETVSVGKSKDSAEVSATGIPAGMTEKDFASFLQQRYLGSFAFYKKLDGAKKNRVFNAYADRPDIDFVRDQIKRQYLDK